MELEKGSTIIWYETMGRFPIRVGLPTDLTLAEAQVALHEIIDFVCELAALPHSDKITVGEAYKIARDEQKPDEN